MGLGGLFPVSFLSFPLTPPALQRSSHQHKAGPRSRRRQDTDICTGECVPEQSPHFLTPSAPVPLISLPPRPGWVGSSSESSWEQRGPAACSLSGQSAVSLPTPVSFPPFLLSFLTPSDVLEEP